MKKFILIVVILFINFFSFNVFAEGSIIRLGVGSSVLANCGRADGGGRISLHARSERYAPFEIEMNYTIARGGFEFILLIDVIRSRYVNWHFLDPGIYFLMDTRPFNNISLERNYDIVLGTGFDIKIPRIPELVVSLNIRFYIPDPERLLAAGRRQGGDAAQDIADRFSIEHLADLEGFIEGEYEGVMDAFENGVRDIFRDVGRSVVISLGLKYYF